MTSRLYRVIFNGRITKGQDKKSVKNRLKNIFTEKDEKKFDALFSGNPIIVKNKVDYETAIRIKEIFEKAGAFVKIEKISQDLIICPKCGCEQKIADECKRCGMAIQPMKYEICDICGKKYSTLKNGSNTVCPSCSNKQHQVKGPKSTVKKIKKEHKIAAEVTLPINNSGNEKENQSLVDLLSGGEPEDRYVIAEEIAHGGMGVILRSLDKDIRRQVAMKVILSKEPVKPKKLERFIEEAQITGQLEHPNIVPVHELGVDNDGKIYFTMKMVQGLSLAEIFNLLEKGESKAIKKYPISTLLNIFQKICDGISFAHSKNVIHRDLKPANIMVGEFGEVLVMDWGMAKVLGREDISSSRMISTLREETEMQLTQDGIVIGTPSYMPPEQALGKTEKIDHQSDIYSLGAIIYKMLTFKTPFSGHNIREIIKKVTSGDLVAPHERTPERKIPAELSAICMKAMHTKKGNRYFSVKDLSRDISLYLENRQVSVKKDSFKEALVKLIKRNKQASITIAAATVVLLVFAGIFYINIIKERDRAVIAEKAALGEKQKAQYEAYVARIGLAESKIDDNAFNQGKLILNSCPRQFRNWEWGRLKYLCHLDLLTLSGHKGKVSNAVFLPGTDKALSAGYDGKVILWDLESGRVLNVLRELKGLGGSLGVSNDGMVTAAGNTNGDIVVWDLKTGQQLKLLKGHSKIISSLNFSPKGKYLLSSSGDKSIRLWDLNSGKVIWTLRSHLKWVTEAKFSPDGTKCLSGSHDRNAILWDLKTGKVLLKLQGHNDIVTTVAFLSNGKKAVTGTHNGTIRIWNLETGDIVRTISNTKGKLFRIKISPNGKKLVTAGSDWTAKILDIETGKVLRILKGHSDSVFSAKFSSDGKKIITASGDSTAKIWNVFKDSDVIKFKEHDKGISSVGFSPDGMMFLTASHDNSIQIWDYKTGEKLQTLSNHRGGISSAVFSPDSKVVLSGDWGNLKENGYKEGTAYLWDIQSGNEIARFEGHIGGVSSVAFSPDGEKILAGQWGIEQNSGYKYGVARLWDSRTGEEIRVLDGHSSWVSGVAFSPDGNMAITGSGDRTVKLWDLTSGEEMRTFTGHQHWVSSVTFSPDGLYILTSGENWDKSTRLWERSSGKLIRIFTGHRFGIVSAKFSPDGKRILTGSRDHTAKIWDTETGKELISLNHHSEGIYDVAFSPDGRLIITGSLDQTAIIWPAKAWQ